MAACIAIFDEGVVRQLDRIKKVFHQRDAVERLHARVPCGALRYANAPYIFRYIKSALLAWYPSRDSGSSAIRCSGNTNTRGPNVSGPNGRLSDGGVQPVFLQRVIFGETILATDACAATGMLRSVAKRMRGLCAHLRSRISAPRQTLGINEVPCFVVVLFPAGVDDTTSALG